MIGFWCKISIELIWVENYGKMGESHNFWSFPRSSTGTEQSGTGTILVLVDSDRLVPVPKNRYRYPLLCLTSVCILAITFSFLIRFE